MLTKQAIQRPALARQTNLSLQVVADLLAELERRGLVVVNGRFIGIPGRSNLTYGLAAGAAAALAACISASWIDVALCDIRGTVIAQERVQLEPDGPALDEQIAAAVRLACGRAGIERFRLGAALVHVDEEANGQYDLVDLGAQLGCAVVTDRDAARVQRDRLELARLDLLDQLFGRAAG